MNENSIGDKVASCRMRPSAEIKTYHGAGTSLGLLARGFRNGKLETVIDHESVETARQSIQNCLMVLVTATEETLQMQIAVVRNAVQNLVPQSLLGLAVISIG